jgi:hypothetical protein
MLMHLKRSLRTASPQSKISGGLGSRSPPRGNPLNTRHARSVPEPVELSFRSIPARGSGHEKRNEAVHRIYGAEELPEGLRPPPLSVETFRSS